MGPQQATRPKNSGALITQKCSDPVGRVRRKLNREPLAHYVKFGPVVVVESRNDAVDERLDKLRWGSDLVGRHTEHIPEAVRFLRSKALISGDVTVAECAPHCGGLGRFGQARHADSRPGSECGPPLAMRSVMGARCGSRSARSAKDRLQAAGVAAGSGRPAQCAGRWTPRGPKAGRPHIVDQDVLDITQ